MAVHETGSVRAAAEALHVTPPAFSAASAALESALGTTLFSKADRGIVATGAGETFAGYVRKLLGLLTEAAGAAVAAARQGLGVTLVRAEAGRPQPAGGKPATYPVRGTPLERPWHLCTASEPTAATRLFLQHVWDPERVGEAAFHTRSHPKG